MRRRIELRSFAVVTLARLGVRPPEQSTAGRTKSPDAPGDAVTTVSTESAATYTVNSITIAGADGNNVIKSGETVRVIRDAPGSEQSFALSRSTI